MRSYLLDTNICIYYLKGLYDLQNKVSQVGVSRCYLSEITVAELRFGAEKSARKEENHLKLNAFCQSFTLLPITGSIEVYATEKARLQRMGGPVDEFDLLIGSTAIAHNLTLVTNNTRHFQLLSDIKLEDWTTENPDFAK